MSAFSGREVASLLLKLSPILRCKKKKKYRKKTEYESCTVPLLIHFLVSLLSLSSPELQHVQHLLHYLRTKLLGNKLDHYNISITIHFQLMVKCEYCSSTITGKLKSHCALKGKKKSEESLIPVCEI